MRAAPNKNVIQRQYTLDTRCGVILAGDYVRIYPFDNIK